jgi:hypothetical protein
MKKKEYYNLVGQDGNAFALMAYTKKAMRETGVSEKEVTAVLNEAKASDYSHLVLTLEAAIQKCNDRNLP